MGCNSTEQRGKRLDSDPDWHLVGEGEGQRFLFCTVMECKMACQTHVFSKLMMSTRAAGMKDLNFNDVMEITNGQTWQNSSQNSVFWRGAQCHG